MQLTVRHCAIKVLLTLIFGAVTYFTAVCPCQRVGNCHLKKLLVLVLAGTGILLAENMIPTAIKS